MAVNRGWEPARAIFLSYYSTTLFLSQPPKKIQELTTIVWIECQVKSTPPPKKTYKLPKQFTESFFELSSFERVVSQKQPTKVWHKTPKQNSVMCKKNELNQSAYLNTNIFLCRKKSLWWTNMAPCHKKKGPSNHSFIHCCSSPIWKVLKVLENKSTRQKQKIKNTLFLWITTNSTSHRPVLGIEVRSLGTRVPQQQRWTEILLQMTLLSGQRSPVKSLLIRKNKV